MFQTLCRNTHRVKQWENRPRLQQKWLKFPKFSKFQISPYRVQCVSECQWRYSNTSPRLEELSEALHDHLRHLPGKIFGGQIWVFWIIAKNTVFLENHEGRRVKEFDCRAHSEVNLRPRRVRLDPHLEFGSRDSREITLNAKFWKSIFDYFSLWGPKQPF